MRAPFSHRSPFLWRWCERSGRRLAHFKTVLIEPLVYLRADELASWGLILRMPARKRDRIAWSDADDRRAHSFTPSGRLSLRATMPENWAPRGKRFVAFRYK